MADSGRRTSSSSSSEVTEARSDSFLWMSWVVNPLVSLGTTNPADAFVGARPDHRDVRDRAVGDPHLLAVQDPVRAVTAGARAHRTGIRAGVGLGQTETADRLAGGHPRQPVLLLLLRSPAPDGEHRQRPLDRDQRPHAAVARLELHAGQPVGGRRGAGAPVPLQVHPEQAELPQFTRQLDRDRPGLEPVADVRGDLVGDECADGVANVALLIGQLAIDRQEVTRIEGWRSGNGCHRWPPAWRVSGCRRALGRPARGRASTRKPRLHLPTRRR